MSYPYVNYGTTASSTTATMTFTPSYAPVYVGGTAWAPPPRPQTPLEWLDAEVEKTCAVARGAK